MRRRASVGRTGVGIAIAFSATFLQAQAIDKIFDGKPKVLNVVHHWSWGLQHCISAAYNKCGINYFKLETNNLASPSIDNDLQPYNTTNMNWATLSFPSDTPTIVIACCGPGYPISGPQDTAAINLGVRKIEKFVELLKTRGADLVFVTSHHHRWNRYRDMYSKTPPYADMSDTLVYNEYNRRMGKTMAINVATPTYNEFPLAVVGDLEHLTSLGKAIYGSQWMKAMYGYDGIAAPTVLDDWITTSRQESSASMNRVKCTVVSPAVLDTLQWGDTVVVDFEATDSNRVYQDNPPNDKPKYLQFLLLGFIGPTMGQFVIEDSIPAVMKKRFTLVIPDSSDVAMYAPGGRPNYFPLYVDSAKISVRPMSGAGLAAYTLSDGFILTDRSGRKFETGVHASPADFVRGPRIRWLGEGITVSGATRGTVVRVMDARGRLIASLTVGDPLRVTRLGLKANGMVVVSLTGALGEGMAVRPVAVR